MPTPQVTIIGSPKSQGYVALRPSLELEGKERSGHRLPGQHCQASGNYPKSCQYPALPQVLGQKYRAPETRR